MDRVVSGVLLALFFVSVVWFIRCLLFPFQWELVVENDFVCWGRVDGLIQQKRIAVSQLVRLVYDKSDNQVFGDVGKIVLKPIGAEVLMRSEDTQAFIECMRKEFPQLKIEAR